MTTAALTSTGKPRRRRSPKVTPPPAAVQTTSQSDALVSEPQTPVKVYVARKKMKVSGKQLMPGDVVEEASDWLRVESWVRAGFLNEEWR